MPSVKTQAIVLKNADYRDHDRMLTLLTPQFGRIDALCRGCKRNNSPLLAASECFCCGEYMLYQSKNKYSVTSCSITDAFYPLRENFEQLKYAFYILSVCEAAAYPGIESLSMYTLLIRSLTRLSYRNYDPVEVTSSFLLFFSIIQGYRPEISKCIVCGKNVSDMNDPLLFDIDAGGIVCEHDAGSGSSLFRISEKERNWIAFVSKNGIEKNGADTVRPPFQLLKKYVESRLERNLPAGKDLTDS